MSTMRSPIGSAALRNQQAPAMRQPAPSPPAVAQPKSQPAARQDRQAQSLWLILIVTSALFCVAAGVLYLSSYASLTREAYRRVHLQGQLQAEIDKSAQFQQMKARINTTEYIETQARKLGMVPAKDSEAIVIGRSR